jgi:4-hydroxybenzoate polyprenyltransferase
MHAVSLLFGTTIIAIALGLESHRRYQDFTIERKTNLDIAYMTGRRRYRLWTNLLMGTIGGLALAAGLIGRGPTWIVLWTLVPLVLVVIVCLAVSDMFHTRRYLQEKLPELRRQTLDRHQDSSSNSSIS